MNEFTDEKLCFIKYIGENNNGSEYEFYFTEHLDDFWGESFNVKPCFLAPDLSPFENCYDMIKRITLSNGLKLDLAMKDTSHSFQDCIDHVIAIAAQNIDNITEYPKEGRLVLDFGESFDETEKKLSERNCFFV